MAIYNSNDRGHYPYSFEVEPWYNGKPLSRDNSVYLAPMYSNVATADAFAFSTDAQYSTAGTYVDLSMVYPGITSWYTTLSGHGGPSNELNHPGSTGNWQMGSTPFFKRQDGSTMSVKASIWMVLWIGDQPHPGYGTAETYFAMVRTSPGANNGSSFYIGDGTSNYPSQPREYVQGSRKIRVSGQNYGNGNYTDWVCIANQQAVTGGIADISCNTVRIINIGRNTGSNGNLRIAGFKVVYHVLPGPGTSYGNFDV